MNKKQKTIIVSLALLAGFIGGIISNNLPLREILAGTKPGIQTMEKLFDKNVDQIVQAEQFKLMDKKGKTRAALYLGPAGDSNALPVLQFYTEQCLAAQLGWNVQGELALELWDGCKPRIKVALAKEEGSPYISLYDKMEKARATFGSVTLRIFKTGAIEKRPESSLVMFDKAGTVLWAAP